MVRYRIRVNTGDADTTNTFHFVHKDWQNVTAEESDKAFDEAVRKLDRIYKDYGRFATKTGVARLFGK